MKNRIISIMAIFCMGFALSHAAKQEIHQVAYDNFGDEYQQPNLVQGGSFAWGAGDWIPEEIVSETSPELSVAHHPNEVIFEYSGMVPAAQYQLRLSFLSDDDRSMEVFADSTRLSSVVLAQGSYKVETLDLPKKSYADGKVRIAVKNIAGVNAAISTATLYSTDKTPVGIPPKKREMQPITFDLPLYRPIDAEHVASLDGDWEVAPRNDGDWQPCRMPGQLLQQGFAIGENQLCALEKTFELPAEWSGKTIVLRFDAVHGNAEYSLNGIPIGKSERLFTPVEFDITSTAKAGANRLEIAMKLKSESEQLSLASMYAHQSLLGIPRSVRVFALPKVHLTALAIETDLDKEYRDASLNLTLEASDTMPVSMVLSDAKGTQVVAKTAQLEAGQNTFELPVENPDKWTAETPNLYDLSVKVGGTYTINRKVGFREIEVVGSRILVNGQPVKLAGVCRHEIDPLSGRADTVKWAEKDAMLFKQANANYVRTAHYPHTQEFLDACDRVGLYVESEAPFCWVRGKQFNDDYLAMRFIEPTLAMVSYQRNHPSVIAWSLSNESGWTMQDPEAPLGENFKRQFEAVRRHDKTRFVCMNNEWSRDGGLGDVATMHYQHVTAAEKEPTGRPMLMDENQHTVAYQPTHLRIDPGLRDAWGDQYFQWQEFVHHDRWQGAAIWAAIDEVFELANAPDTGYGPWGCICDAYRRIKPEFWHVKMNYSPVWIEQTRLDALPEGSTNISLRLENRYSFTNLKTLTAEWEYLGKTGHVALPDIKPWSKAALEIGGVPPTVPGETLALSISNEAGDEICRYGIRTGKLEIDIPTPQGMPRFKRRGDVIAVKGGSMEFKLNTKTGVIEGTLPYIELPRPYFVQNEVGFVGRVIEYYLDKPDAASRAIEKVECSESGGLLKIVVHEKYDGVEGTLTWTLGSNGVSTFDYEYEMTQKEFDVLANDGTTVKAAFKLISENGLVFTLPASFDTLSWEKDTLWGVAPGWHIGRPKGTAKAHYSGSGERPWQLDENELGTKDFRSSKYKVRRVLLGNDEGQRFFFEGDGTAHARASLAGDNTLLRLFNRTDATSGSFTIQP